MTRFRVALGAAMWACTAALVASTVPAGAQEQAKPLTPYAQRFIELFDIDRDGKVSVDEIATDQGRLFSAIDIDGNNQLSTDEVRRRGRFLQMWRTTTVFDLLDVNGDGVLTIEEINAPTRRWFRRYDTNGDGRLDTAELPDRRAWGDNSSR